MAKEQPPALPVKLHSLGSDSVLLSPAPAGVHQLDQSNNDVFAEALDCHEPQCPIHQRYDPFRHDMRYFSDCIPPPVPKKRLTRTLSFPGPSGSPSSPLPTHQKDTVNFDNPLYMMAPSAESSTPAGQSALTSPFFSQVSLDTPEEHLLPLFNNFDDHYAVSQTIQHHHLVFLRSMAERVEAQILLQERSAGKTSSHQLQDFLSCEGNKPKRIGAETYYRLQSSMFPGRTLGLRVHTQRQEASPAPSKHKLVHVNVQEVLAYFEPETARDSALTFTPQKEQAVAIMESPADSSDYRCSGMIVQYFLQRGFCVSIERDLPDATMEDFVKDATQLIESADYDRQVCVLLLQIFMGTHHLYSSSSTLAQLRPEEILLAWPTPKQDTRNDLSIDSREKEERDWVTSQTKGRIQVLQETYGSPRVVLKPKASYFILPDPLNYLKQQLGALLEFCLHPLESRTSQNSNKSSYWRGLLHLSGMLKGEGDLLMSNMVALLQGLLWGPQLSFYRHHNFSKSTVQHWLTAKRALLLMRMAESALKWEDCLCLHYLSFTDPEMVVSMGTQLWDSLTARPTF